MDTLNLYAEYDCNNNKVVILEVYGLLDPVTNRRDLVEKVYFGSYDAARYYILKNNLH